MSLLARALSMFDQNRQRMLISGQATGTQRCSCMTWGHTLSLSWQLARSTHTLHRPYYMRPAGNHPHSTPSYEPEKNNEILAYRKFMWNYLSVMTLEISSVLEWECRKYLYEVGVCRCEQMSTMAKGTLYENKIRLTHIYYQHTYW